MTGVEERQAMRQLLGPIAALCRAPPPARQQVDIAFARKIEAVANWVPLVIEAAVLFACAR